MPNVVENNIRLFANDTKLFSRVDNDLDYQALQLDLDRLQTWAQKWQLSFNASKCKVMHLGNQNSEASNVMRNDLKVIEVETSNCEKDLGVHVDNKLKFNVQAEIAANKGNKFLGVI